MRENRTHGSEGGEGESRFRPLSGRPSKLTPSVNSLRAVMPKSLRTLRKFSGCPWPSKTEIYSRQAPSPSAKLRINSADGTPRTPSDALCHFDRREKSFLDPSLFARDDGLGPSLCGLCARYSGF